MSLGRIAIPTQLPSILVHYITSFTWSLVFYFCYFFGGKVINLLYDKNPTVCI